MEKIINVLCEEVDNQEIRKDYCEYCGKTGRAFETHHIKSRGAGGGEARANKINLCVECHARAQEYMILPWELVVRVAYREKSSVTNVYAAIGWPAPDNIDELEAMLKVPKPIFEPLEKLVSMLVSSEETQVELEFFRGQVIDAMVYMGCTLGWIASNIGRSTGYIRQRLVTYRTFPNESDRAKDLSWTHHRIIALSANDNKTPQDWLDEAVKEQYSTRQLEQVVRGEQPPDAPLDSRQIKAKEILDEITDILGLEDDVAAWLSCELRKLLDGVCLEVA